MEKLTYADLSSEDKLLIDGLYKLKDQKLHDRKIIRNIMYMLRQSEMKCTREIMNLTQEKIGEKFDLGKNSAKPLTKKNREELLNKKAFEDIKKVNNVKAIRNGANGREPRGHSRGIAQDFWCHC